MNGKVVEEERQKGIEMWKECGRIDDDDWVGWVREVRNERSVCERWLRVFDCMLFNDD